MTMRSPHHGSTQWADEGPSPQQEETISLLIDTDGSDEGTKDERDSKGNSANTPPRSRGSNRSNRARSNLELLGQEVELKEFLEEWEMRVEGRSEETESLLHQREMRVLEPSNPAIDGIPRFFRASWPSRWDQLMHYVRPAADIYVWCAIVYFHFLAPAPAPTHHPAWRFLLTYKSVSVWLPFLWRFMRGFLHLLISFAILPAPLLYHEGPLLKFYPKSMLESLRESFVFRELFRPRLVHAGGVSIQILCPDGAMIDGMYFKSPEAKPNGPTVIRFNGNAEAFEFQDETLPRMYNGNGINLILFNYRGVGRSRWVASFRSELFGHLFGLCRTPVIRGTAMDAWAVVEYAVNGLGVPPAQLVLLGHSIGGAIAAHLAASHSSLPLPLCSSRSFASLVRVAMELAPGFFGLPAGSPKAKMLRRVAWAGLYLSGWEYDSVGNWYKVSGFKWIEYASSDHIIPYDLSLHAVVQADQEKPSRKRGNRNRERTLRVIQLIDAANTDNHNRLLFETEMMQHLEMVSEAIGRENGHVRPEVMLHA